MRTHILLTLMTSGAFLATPALAQESAAAVAAADNTGTDIVVTAQRRSERLQDVPVSVQAVSADQLRAAGVTDQRQLALVSPSLQVQQDNNYAVRGVGTQSFSNTIESSVATAVDDVTLGTTVLNGNPFIDVAQVEVLNGPQGLLFGKNASAGLVNITTKRPELGKYDGSFDVEAVSRYRPGSDGTGVNAKATINVPVGDNAALRINGIYRYDEALVQNVRENATGRFDPDYRQYGARAKFLYEPNDQLSVYLLGEYFEQRGIGTQFETTFRTLGANSISTDYLAGAGITPSKKNLYALSDAPGYRDLNTGGAQANVSYKFDNGWALTDVFAWKAYSLHQQIDGDGVSANGANVNAQNHHYNQFSNELRLALPDSGPLSGQVGAYFFKSTLDQQSQIAGNNLVPDFVVPNAPFCVGATVSGACPVSNSYFLGQDKDYHLTNRSYAVFGQFTYAVTDKFKLIAGARVTRDRVAIDLKQNMDNYFVTLGFPDATYNQSYAATTLSYRAGAQYNFNRDLMVYATYGRGWKGPGMNDTGANADAVLRVLPERADTAEAGIKSSLFNRLLTLNVSVFRTEFSNLQAQTYDTDLRTFVIGNAGKAITKGAEANVALHPMHGLTLNANVSYIDAKYKDFAGAQCYVGQTGCSADSTFNAGGNRLTYAPKLTSTLSASYELPISDASSLLLDASYYHRSKEETLVNAPPGSAIDPIDILNASLGFKSDRFTAAVFCKNCTNKIYAVSTSTESGDSNAGILTLTQRFGLDSMRTIGVRFGYTF